MSDNDIKVVGLAGSKSKGKINWKVLSAVIGIVVLSLGIIAGIILVRQQQDLREKAQRQQCPQAQQCPSLDGKHLLNCNPPEADNSPQDSLCRVAGQTSVCGQENFCCPVAGGKWTKDMSKCQTQLTPAPTASGTISCSSNFSDTFDSLNTDNWIKYGDAAVSSGQLVLSVASGATSGSLITYKNLLTGDFAITFDATALTETGTGSVASMLNLSTSNQSKIVTVGRNIKQGVHSAGANFAPGNKNKSAAIKETDNVGFKVERKAGKITVYYKVMPATEYTELIAFTDTISEDLSVSLQAISITGSPTPALSAKFDNFAIGCLAVSSTATATATSTSGSKTATPTATATSGSGSGSSTKTATPTATSTTSGGTSAATATPAPIPVTGANWPTIIGAGFGVIMLVVSFGLAL